MRFKKETILHPSEWLLNMCALMVFVLISPNLKKSDSFCHAPSNYPLPCPLIWWQLKTCISRDRDPLISVCICYCRIYKTHGAKKRLRTYAFLVSKAYSLKHISKANANARNISRKRIKAIWRSRDILGDSFLYHVWFHDYSTYRLEAAYTEGDQLKNLEASWYQILRSMMEKD